MFSMSYTVKRTTVLLILLVLAGVAFFAIHKAIAEVDGPNTDGPLRAYVKRSVSGAWMRGFTETECTEYGVYYGCWEIYVKFDDHKIPDDGAVSGHTLYEYLDEDKHGGQKKAKKSRISVDSYIYGYEQDVGRDRWTDAWLSGE